MVAPYPDTDARGVKELRVDLEQEIVALVPALSRPPRGGEFGNAFYELALRMAAQVTSRLNKTAQRDALAFFDALDIPPMAPRAAEAPLVFTLAEKKDEPVTVPKGTQVGAATDKDEVIFETLHGLTVTPARLEHLAAVDVGSDVIEQAPANVRSTEPPAGPFPTYRLATFADVGSATIQVAPAVGLEAGDLVRIAPPGGKVYRIDKIQGDLCTLEPKLEASADAATVVEKVTQFDAFTLRDVQAHRAYIGHSELLKLEQLARITLEIGPAGVARRLGGMQISATLYGTPAAGQVVGGQVIGSEPKPDWYPIDFEGVNGNSVSFVKSWIGKVEKFKVGGNDSLWLRLSLDEDVGNRAEIGTRVNTLKLRIKSPPEDEAATSGAQQEKDGSKGIERAAYNGTPLSVAASFLPFGPEPRRFDTFSLAAPEALSKTGATVTLDVTLVDGTPGVLTMALKVSGPPRAYAIGRNGRLQAIAFEQGAMRTQEIEEPQSLPSAPAGGPAPNLRLDDSKSLHAIQIDTATQLDLVIAQDQEGRLWSITVLKQQGPPAFKAFAWNLLWTPPSPTEHLVCALALRSSDPTVPFFALILTKTGAVRLLLTQAGALAAAPKPLGSTGAPTFGDTLALVPVEGPSWPALPTPAAAGPEVVMIDANGALWTAAIHPTNNTAIAWIAITAPTAMADVRPAACKDLPGHLFVAAADSGNNGTLFIADHNAATFRTPNLLPDFYALRGTSILALPAHTDVGADQPLFTAIGKDQFVGGSPAGNLVAAMWTHRDHLELTSLPPADLPEAPQVPQGIWVAGENPGVDRPQLLLGGKRESLVTAPLVRPKETVAVTLYDALLLEPPLQSPGYVELDPGGTPTLLSAPPLRVSNGTTEFYSLSRPNSVPDYRFFGAPSLFNNGSYTTNSNQFQLGGTDTAAYTPSVDFLIINNQVYTVTSGTTVLTVTPPNLPTTGTSTSYRRVTRLLNAGSPTRTVQASDRAILVEVTTSTFNTLHVASFSMTGGAPLPQSILLQSNPWLLLGSGWTGAVVPTGPDADIEKEFAITGPFSTRPLRNFQNPELAWEYSNGRSWKHLDLSKDETRHLATSGKIEFTVPGDLAPAEIGGQEDYWISARLIGGSYGQIDYIVASTPPPTGSNTFTQTITADDSNLNPPEILSIKATFVLSKAVAPQLVLVENNGAVLNQTQAAAEAQASFELFEGALALDPNMPPDSRSIFLGFSKRFGVNPLTLYAGVEEQDGEETLAAFVLTQQGQKEWSAVSVEDETAAFRRSGFVRISMPVAPVRASLFGRDLYWLRLAPKSATDWKPRIKGLYVNAVAAGQAKTVVQEILGSSAGEPNQVYSLSEMPVILLEAAGAVREGVVAPLDVELRVRESSLSEEERDALNTTLSRGDIKGVENPPDIPGDWVLWQRVDSFVGQDGDARIFRLDPANGTVAFGDGRQGKIPPAGRDAIRAFRYQQGGGKQGNVAAYAIKSLKTALESVEAVTNPVEATGGIDAPDVEQLITTAPTRLRNANRALSGADMEALAMSSSPDVVRARHIMPRDAKDKMRLAVAVRTGQARPRPSIARRKALAKYIIEHAAGMLEPDDLDVIPPEYAPVAVTVDLLANSADVMSEVERAARQRLAAFLDPIDGGPDGKGWPFGRRIWPSDIYRIVSAIPGVDRIAAVKIDADSGVNLDRLSAAALICAAENGLKVNVETGGMT
jgi:hypothetical protein